MSRNIGPIIDLKVISNYEIDYQNKIIKGERTPLNYANLQNYYLKKNAKIEEIINHRKKILERDDDIHKEIKNEKYKKSGWIFY